MSQRSQGGGHHARASSNLASWRRGLLVAIVSFSYFALLDEALKKLGASVWMVMGAATDDVIAFVMHFCGSDDGDGSDCASCRHETSEREELSNHHIV